MIKRIALLLSFFLLASCRVGNSVIATSTITPIPTITPTATYAPTLIPTITDTPTVSPEVMNYQCLEIMDRPPKDYGLKGTLVYNSSDNSDAFLLNTDTGYAVVRRFPRAEGDRLLEYDVSPDRKHILYLHSSDTTDKFVIATADGKPIWSLITEYYWNWFDNEHLIGFFVSQDRKSSLVLLNPFTGDKQELRTDYPDSRLFLNDPSDRWAFGHGGLPVYDPTLTRAIYPECDSNCFDALGRGEGGWPIALRDVETNEVIARILTTDSYGASPLWTPDGKQFIIATNIDPRQRNIYASEFFVMSREGELSQLTHFTDYYKEVDIRDSYSLSPDGKLLAFWVVAKPSRYDSPSLAVLNIETDEVINYCIPSEGYATPIWSPDGTQLLVNIQDSPDQSTWHTLFVDLARSYAAKLGDADIVQPVGWMVSP